MFLGEFQWEDTTPVNNSAEGWHKWYSGEPSAIGEDGEYCMEQRRNVNQQNDKWNDERCTKPREFVCKKSQSKFFTLYLN